MRCCGGGRPQAQGSDLVAVAAALSIFIAQGKTPDELAILASLFDLMRSNIALMAVNAASDDVQPNLGNTGTAADRAEFFDSLIGTSPDPFE